MKNLDAQAKLKQEKQAQLQADLKAAFDSGDNDKVSSAMVEMANHVQQNILAEYNNMTADMLADRNVLAARGVKPLTAAETKYYNAVIAGNGFDGTEELVPATVYNRVFEELKEKHELLKHINFVNATATTEWIIKVGDIKPAWWGKLSAHIKELLDDGFDKINMNLFKLSCYIPVSKSMLLLGPEWLDRYIREILGEAMAIGLETAIVAGTGVDSPVGMIKDMSTFNATTGHPDKTATAITDLEPVTLGSTIMSPLTHNGKRSVDGVLLVVNPLDYWEKIFGATTYLNANGQYVFNILPIPGKFVQSTAVPKGKMVAGMAKDYFMGIGFSQKIEYSDEYHFVEDERVYLTKIAANGRPIDGDSFIVFDISELKPSLNK